MKITIMGAGYVGLVAATCFANFGIKVCCLDKDPDKINLLNSGKIHIHEPGLEELVWKNLSNGNLRFSTDPRELAEGNLLIIAVGTPQAEDGSANLAYIHSAIDDIANHCTTDKFIIIKSTVPIGTAKMISEQLKLKKPELNFEMISNPEFLKEGDALRDFLNPEKIWQNPFIHLLHQRTSQ
jgi:UDPglucose 6-dehydrogenase